MFTTFILFSILLPCMAENIPSLSNVSIAFNHTFASLIEDNCKSALSTLESTTLDVFREKYPFIHKNHKLRYVPVENPNIQKEKDQNKYVQLGWNNTILMQTKKHDKYHIPTKNKVKRSKETESNLKNMEVLQTENTLKLYGVSLNRHTLFVGVEENYSYDNDMEAEGTFNSDRSTESSHDIFNKIEQKQMQTRLNQKLIMPIVENHELYSQLKTKRHMNTKNHKGLDTTFMLNRSKVKSPYIKKEKRIDWNMQTKSKSESLEDSHKEHMQYIKSQRLPPKKVIYKRNIQAQHRKEHIHTSTIYPQWIEQSKNMSIKFYSSDTPLNNSQHVPIDILKDKEISKSEVDNRIITTLMYSQMRVEPKIVYGNAAQTKDFPFLVSLKRALQKISKTRKLWKNYCGGSIINSKKVLTAAHCFEMNNYDYYYHPNKLRVVAGSLTNKLEHSGNTSNSNRHQVRQIKILKLHSDFNFPMNDIALVFVDEPFQFDHPMNINYIAPARYHTDYSRHCYAAGFGQSKPKGREDGSTELLWAEINLMSRKQCDKVWEIDMNSFLCSLSVLEGVGGGDSGGPVACSNTLDPSIKSGSGKLLVGIVSGRNYDKTTLYTRVSAYREWIDSNKSCIREFRIALVLLALIKAFCTLYGGICF